MIGEANLLAVLERIASALEVQARVNAQSLADANHNSDRIANQQEELIGVSKQAYASQIASYQANLEYYQLQLQAMRAHMADCPTCSRQMADAHPGHQA